MGFPDAAKDHLPARASGLVDFVTRGSSTLSLPNGVEVLPPDAEAIRTASDMLPEYNGPIPGWKDGIGQI